MNLSNFFAALAALAAAALGLAHATALAQSSAVPAVPAAPPPQAAAAPAAADEGAASPPRAPRTPRYLLRAPNGRAVTSETFNGRVQLVTFGFTSCADVCPTTLLELQQVLRALGPRAAQVQAIFISVDPERDTPEVLAAYTRAFDPRIVGLGGSEALVRRAAESFGVVYRKVPSPGAAANAYTVDHSTGLFVLDADGVWMGKIGFGTPVAEIVKRVEDFIEEAFPLPR